MSEVFDREVALNLWSRNDGEDDAQWCLTAYGYSFDRTETDVFVSVWVSYEVVERFCSGYDSWFLKGDPSFDDLMQVFVLGVVDRKVVNLNE